MNFSEKSIKLYIGGIVAILLPFFFSACAGNDDFDSIDLWGSNYQFHIITNEDLSPCQPTPYRYREDDKKLRILAIGNSFSQDAVENYLYELFDAGEIPVKIGHLAIGGCSLQQHWENALSNEKAYSYTVREEGSENGYTKESLRDIIESEEWDIITLQQASPWSGIYDTYEPFLSNLIEWISQLRDCHILFHQTWAYPKNSKYAYFPNYDHDQGIMYKAILDASSFAIDNHSAINGIIPSGTSIQNGRTSFIGDNFHRDDLHLNYTYGRFTAACTWYEAISGRCVLENSFVPEIVGKDEELVAKMAAHLAVKYPFALCDLRAVISHNFFEGE